MTAGNCAFTQMVSLTLILNQGQAQLSCLNRETLLMRFWMREALDEVSPAGLRFERLIHSQAESSIKVVATSLQRELLVMQLILAMPVGIKGLC